MDKFVKFSVPINKENVNWDAEYMCYGGSQLIEIMEKDISYDEIIEDASRLNFSQSQVERLECWTRHDCDIVAVEKELNLTQTARSFFYRGAGILAKLYQMIDVSPIVEDKHFISRFSFIKYKVSKMDLGYIVQSQIIIDKWSGMSISKQESDSLMCYYLYDKNIKRIYSDSELGQELLDSFTVMEKLMDSI